MRLAASEPLPPSQVPDQESAKPPPEWRVWQLVDSAFPTGGFAHSGGLEAAFQHGAVRDRGRLFVFCEASLGQLGHAALPFVSASFDQPLRLPEFDHLCDTFTTNHVANRASRLQGRAFLTATSRIFQTSSSQRAPAAPEPLGHTPFAHLAPVFGATLANLDLPRETALRLFVFNHLRGLMAAAVRLNIIGTMEAQRLQWRLAERAEQVSRDGGELSLDDICQTAPLLDIWQGAQDRLYSRLYQS